MTCFFKKSQVNKIKDLTVYNGLCWNPDTIACLLWLCLADTNWLEVITTTIRLIEVFIQSVTDCLLCALFVCLLYSLFILWFMNYRKSPKNSNTWKIAVTILKIEQCGSTIE